MGAVDTLRICIEGTPRPWVRPQRAGGYARKQKTAAGWVDPPGVAHLESLKQHVFAAVADAQWDQDGPVEVEVMFLFGIGKFKDESRTLITVRKLGESSRGQWRTKVPDLDNLTKLVGEALQHGGAVNDDTQIVRLVAEKVEYPA